MRDDSNGQASQLAVCLSVLCCQLRTYVWVWRCADLAHGQQRGQPLIVDWRQRWPKMYVVCSALRTHTYRLRAAQGRATNTCD